MLKETKSLFLSTVRRWQQVPLKRKWIITGTRRYVLPDDKV